MSLGSVEMRRQVGEWEAVRMESGEGSLRGLVGDCGNRPSVSVVRVHTHMRVTKTQSTSSDISSPSFVEQYCWIAISTAFTLYQVSRETYRRLANSVTIKVKDLSIPTFWYLCGVLEPSPRVKQDCRVESQCLLTFMKIPRFYLNIWHYLFVFTTGGALSKVTLRRPSLKVNTCGCHTLGKCRVCVNSAFPLAAWKKELEHFEREGLCSNGHWALPKAGLVQDTCTKPK